MKQKQPEKHEKSSHDLGHTIKWANFYAVGVSEKRREGTNNF